MRSIRVALVAVVLAASACSQEGSAPEQPPGDGNAEAEVRWAYTGEAGPEQWASLSERFALCASGRAQSPIDLTGAAEAGPAGIEFDYSTGEPTIVNNGHTIQVNFPAGNSMRLDGTSYELLRLDLHRWSEHTIDGRPYPLEAHFVHKSADDALAVIGVMVEAGEENGAYGPIFSALPAEPGSAEPLGAQVDPSALLPEDRTSFRYDGSLTAPPCTEGVTWTVMRNPVTVSQAQIEAFGAIYTYNARPVQPLNGRGVRVG